ncbi:MAG TPA: ABC transporter ATP-binding protein [Dermatophilaceae bacterium]|nr:ABC transporter ATP-binding protein [Dermatophilaceae bacterium]
MTFSASAQPAAYPTSPTSATSPSATSTAGPTPIARAVDLVKTYGTGPGAVRAVDGIDLTIRRGEFTAVMGPSGSGKSTLMHCLAGLDTATSGQVWLGDTDLTRLGDAALTRVRRDRIGFVFQSFNLLPTLTAAQNIVLPIDLAGRAVDPAWHDRLVDVLGLRDRLGHRPSELSGGQQQRVAMARAMITRPDILFADEPTGALDTRTSAEMLDFLRTGVRELGQTIVMVTHDPGAAAYAGRVVFLSDGRIAGELTAPTRESVLATMSEWVA